jgi:hypothetical protein
MRNWKRFITAAAVGIVTACAASGVQSGGTESNAAVTGTVRVTGRVTARDGAPVANARVYVQVPAKLRERMRTGTMPSQVFRAARRR